MEERNDALLVLQQMVLDSLKGDEDAQKNMVTMAHLLKNGIAKTELRFREGRLLKAMKAGSFVMLDEINLANEESIGIIYQLLTLGYLEYYNRDSGMIEKIFPRKGFALIATANPASYAGRNKFSEAFLNRFELHYIDDMQPEEMALIVSEEIKRESKRPESGFFSLDTINEAVLVECVGSVDTMKSFLADASSDDENRMSSILEKCEDVLGDDVPTIEREVALQQACMDDLMNPETDNAYYMLFNNVKRPRYKDIEGRRKYEYIRKRFRSVFAESHSGETQRLKADILVYCYPQLLRRNPNTDEFAEILLRLARMQEEINEKLGARMFDQIDNSQNSGYIFTLRNLKKIVRDVDQVLQSGDLSPPIDILIREAYHEYVSILVRSEKNQTNLDKIFKEYIGVIPEDKNLEYVVTD